MNVTAVSAAEPPSQFWKLTRLAYDDTGPFGLLTNPVNHVSGKSATLALLTQNASLSAGAGNPIFSLAVGGKRLADLLTYALYESLIVSDEAMQSFAVDGVQIDTSIPQLDLEVVTRSASGRRYVILLPGLEHDVLDRTQSDIQYLAGTTVVAKVTREVIRGPILPAADLFKVMDGSWVATDRLRDSVATRRLTGFHFEPADVSD